MNSRGVFLQEKHTVLRIGDEKMFFTNRKLIRRISVGIAAVLVMAMVIGAVGSYL